jgi:TRAP transporter TAXI family solute receptor
MIRFTRRAAMAALAASALTSAPAVHAQEPANYILSTASTGGTYYPVGVALATLTKVRLEPSTGIGMSAISSAGSGENVRLLREGEAQFAILQGLFGHYAVTGTGPVSADGPQENVRSITMLWPNVEHFVVAADRAGDGTLSAVMDLKGEAMALGSQNSGTIGSNRVILGNMGLNIDEDFDLVYAGYGPSAEALQNGQVAGISTPAGAPVGAITQLFAAAGDSVRLLTVTEEQMATINTGLDLWTPYPLPAGTYPGQDYDVTTVAQPNFLAVNASVDEEHVYQITKTMFENLAFLRAIHPATNALSLDSALGGLPAPLHPGALRYYEEVGVTVPERLKPKG